MADVQGSTLSRVEEMVFLPNKDDELTQTANFPGKFESITVNYPENMIYEARKDVANTLDFGAKNGKGTDDSYYDGYDPYADWSDAGDNYSDWSDPGDYGDYEDYEDYSDDGDYGDYIDW